MKYLRIGGLYQGEGLFDNALVEISQTFEQNKMGAQTVVKPKGNRSKS